MTISEAKHIDPSDVAAIRDRLVGLFAEFRTIPKVAAEMGVSVSSVKRLLAGLAQHKVDVRKLAKAPAKNGRPPVHGLYSNWRKEGRKGYAKRLKRLERQQSAPSTK